LKRLFGIGLESLFVLVLCSPLVWAASSVIESPLIRSHPPACDPKPDPLPRVDVGFSSHTVDTGDTFEVSIFFRASSNDDQEGGVASLITIDFDSTYLEYQSVRLGPGADHMVPPDCGGTLQVSGPGLGDCQSTSQSIRFVHAPGCVPVDITYDDEETPPEAIILVKFKAIADVSSTKIQLNCSDPGCINQGFDLQYLIYFDDGVEACNHLVQRGCSGTGTVFQDIGTITINDPPPPGCPPDCPQLKPAISSWSSVKGLYKEDN